MLTFFSLQLEDHKIVHHYPPICGVAHSVFYISHSRSETHDEETRSYSNEHEATFLVALCAHLLKQGYKPEQVVLLTPYSGQVRLRNSDSVKKYAFLDEFKEKLMLEEQ